MPPQAGAGSGRRGGVYRLWVSTTVAGDRRLSDSLWSAAAAGIVVAVVVAAFAIARPHLLSDASDDLDVGAAVTFVGLVVSGALSFLAVAVQRSAAAREASQRQREMDRAELEQSNRAAVQLDEMRRLRLEAAVRAAEIVGSAERGGDAAVTAALLALCDLGQAELAVALLFDLWDGTEKRISTDAAVLVVDKAFSDRHERRAQMLAAELLCRNAASLDPSKSTHWPHRLDGEWDPEMWPYTKLLVFDALISMTTTPKPTDNSVAAFAVRLYGAWTCDGDPRVRYCLRKLAEALPSAITARGYEAVMHAGHAVTVGQLTHMQDEVLEKPQDALGRLISSRAEEVARWAGRCEGLDDRVGQLGVLA